MGRNSELNRARVGKNDEFYTDMSDVSKEMVCHRERFRGKTVFLNCDDPVTSAFWEYFHLNFGFLGLKRLIATHYDKDKPTYKLEYCGGDDNEVLVGYKTALIGNGDFRNEECLALLKESDIVVTNPPFSLFREFIGTLIEHEKKFIILGNMNAVTAKEVFDLFRANKVWYGDSIHSGDRRFYVPESYPLNAAGCGIDEDGRRFIRVKGVRWFTNLPVKCRAEKLILYKPYSEAEYPKFNKFDVINVDKTAEIPIDYAGVMAVPISFLDKYNPEQFEIVTLRRLSDGSVRAFSGNEGSEFPVATRIAGMLRGSEGEIGDRTTYARITIRRKEVGDRK